MSALGPDVPVHFTAFHPDYKMINKPQTPHLTLIRAREIARANGLRHVYVGNVEDVGRGSTYCHACGERVIGRRGYTLTDWAITTSGCCRTCGTAIAGVFGEAPGVWGGRRLPVRLRDFEIMGE